MKYALDKIRNFSIIAHIDHGKSTLADRMLEITGTVSVRGMRHQFLDKLEIERERGITIKAQPIRMKYKSKAGSDYILNLIDTPGHVDFSYEVSRSLAACEGAVLLVDATQGVEAQTISNLYLAMELDLTVIPVINKIDMANARIDEVRESICKILGFGPEEILLSSAVKGTGIPEILENIVKNIPPPLDAEPNSKALIFDSTYNTYKGVMMYVKMVSGSISMGEKIRFMSNQMEYEVIELGYFGEKLNETDILYPGEVGYILAGVKNIKDVKIGDTVTSISSPAVKPLPGFKEMKPLVFCGIYPIENEDFEDLRDSIDKIQLNDASLKFIPEESVALGPGFRCGFLGNLHMEITQERLEKEFNLSIIATSPNVEYLVHLNNGGLLELENPSKFPNPADIDYIEEPYIKAIIVTMSDYIGGIMKICEDKRGEFIEMEYITQERVAIHYKLPLNEVIIDFNDKLKSVTKGYGSLDYDEIFFKQADLVKVDILVNSKPVDSLSFITHKDKAYSKGLDLIARLRKIIKKQLFEVVLQAAISSRIIARASISPMRKNVTAKCYGGDITRKRKLLEKQKEGKKRMKMVGLVELPQEAFMAVLKLK